MFKKISGAARVEWYPIDPSVAFTNGQLVYFNGSGELISADATSGDHAGILLKTIAATDADYADARKVAVEVPDSDAIYQVSVGTGTLTTAMIGNQYDLADELNIDVTATAKKVVTVVGFVNGTTALVKINSVVFNSNVVTS